MMQEIRRKPYTHATRFENVPDAIRISPRWTPEERLRVVAALVGLIADDVAAGRYSAPGRPNSVSIQYICGLPAEELEPERETIERMVWEAFNPEISYRMIDN